MVLRHDVYFIPAATKNNSIASSAGPIGSWKAKNMVYPTCYINGTCVNTSSGVLNSNDVALVILGGSVSNLPYAKGADIMDMDGMVMVSQLGIHL